MAAEALHSKGRRELGRIATREPLAFRGAMTPDANLLRGTTALVTGASRGLGLEAARHLAARGANVVLVARDAAALDAAADEVRRARAVLVQTVVAFALDASGAPAVDRMLEEVERQLGGVDVLVNNAAVQGP